MDRLSPATVIAVKASLNKKRIVLKLCHEKKIAWKSITPPSPHTPPHICRLKVKPSSSCVALPHATVDLSAGVRAPIIFSAARPLRSRNQMLLYILLGFMFYAFKRFFFATPTMASAQTKEKVQALIKNKPIFIASKSYCPYCTKTKNTVASITKEAYILELDNEEDGAEIQDALFEITGQRTVPNIFIGGEHIGGNSDLQALQSQDKLEPKIKAVL